MPGRSGRLRTGLTCMTNLQEEHVSIPADGVSLDGRLAYPEEDRPSCAVLLIGAHPLLGGNMSNNVVTALRAQLAAHGAAALSFEYGAPSGASPESWASMLSLFWHTHHVDQEPRWRDHAHWAAQFLQQVTPAPLVLVGYSFGCWVVASLAPAFHPAALVFISPNPVDHDLSSVAAVTVPMLVVTSDDDFSCTPGQLRQWLETLSGGHALHSFTGAEHFFRGREHELGDRVAEFLRSNRLIGD